MRIAVASEGLDVSKHFSSCTNFNFYKVENNELVDSRNLPSQEHLCGSQANFLRQIEVRVLICGTISERDSREFKTAWFYASSFVCFSYRCSCMYLEFGNTLFSH